MVNRTKLATAIKLAMMGAAASTLFAPGVHAQTKELAQLEEVVVVGSRIKTDGLSSPTPVQILSSSDIDVAGVANISELLLKNPTFGSPTISRTNSNFQTASAGVSTVDLRNLGTDRTLVLVDGRRFVSGVPGTQAVDLNTIPTQFIERVEILTGGASSLYGSDAVAGVVNMVYKKDFEGVEFETKFGQSFEGDTDETQYNLTIGGNFADDKGNIAIHGAYTDQGPLYSRDRKRSAVDQYTEMAFTGDINDAFVARTPYYSSYAPQGRFVAGGTSYTYDANGNIKTGFDTNGTTGPADGYNRSAARTIAVPTERYLLATRGHYNFSEDFSAFIEGTYAASQTTSDLEPFALASGDIYAVDSAVPLEFEDPNNPGSYIRNFYVPDEIFNAATDGNGDGARDMSFTRRMAEFGNRGSTADRDTFRVVAGIEGDLTDTWSMDAYVIHGQTKESQVGGGQVNVLNFRSALEAIDDGNGNAICRDAIAREQGCVAANIFGAGALSAGAVDYIKAPGLLVTFVSQRVAGMNFSGDLMELPAGTVGLAVGAEYREEFSRSEFDPLQQAGLNAGNAIPREEGGFDVSEAYTEINIPLISDVFLVDSLSIRGAARMSDYSTVGNKSSWNVGLEWAPIEDLRFRAIQAQSTRAPNITELYSPPSQTFPTGLVDPCTGITAATTGATADACRADAGVMANITANGSFTLNQGDIQGISGFNRGNRDLDAETGKSTTIGAVYTPTGIAVLEDFGFTLDYFNIEIEDAIVSTPRQFILEQCYGGDASYCQFVDRRDTNNGLNSAGSIEFLDSAVTNSGGLATEGVDLTINYSTDLGEWGGINARLAYTHVLDGYTIPLPGAEKDEWAGEVGASADKWNLSVGYNLDNLGVNWTTTFIGEAALDDQFLSSYDFAKGSIKVDAVAYHDLVASYTFEDTYQFTAGVYNLSDEEPPRLITGLPGNDTGVETDGGTYDVVGRRFQIGFKITM